MKKLDLPPPPLSETDIPLPLLTIRKPDPIVEAEKMVDSEVPEEVEKVEDLPPATEEQPETTAQIAKMLRELYQIMSNRFDQIYFKIDQISDMILQERKKEK